MKISKRLTPNAQRLYFQNRRPALRVPTSMKMTQRLNALTPQRLYFQDRSRFADEERTLYGPAGFRRQAGRGVGTPYLAGKPADRQHGGTHAGPGPDQARAVQPAPCPSVLRGGALSDE